MLNRNILFFILLCLFFAPKAQAGEELDSLFRISSNWKTSDSTLLLTNLELALRMKYSADSSFMGFSGMDFYHKSLKLAESDDLMSLLIDRLDHQGVSARNKADYSLALSIHSLELNLADSLGWKNKKVKALNNIGVVYRRLDDYTKGMNFHLQALELAEEINDNKGYVIAGNGLGNIQYILGNYDEALRLFRTCLRMEQSANQLLGVAINLNNIGNVYMKRNELDKALEYYMLSLEVNRELGSSRGIAICYNDIGNIYRLQRNFEKALNYHLMALDLNREQADQHFLAYSYVQAGKIYVDMNEPDKAIFYISKGIELSHNTRAKANLKEAYELMFRVYKIKEKPWEALYYYELSAAMNDSILNEQTRMRVSQMQILFDRERSENQIALLQSEREISNLRLKRQEFYNLLIGVLLIASVMALIMLIFYFRTRTRNNKLLLEKSRQIEKAQHELQLYADRLLEAKVEAEQSNKAKSIFLANMSHEIRTPMNSVIGFADILSNMIQDEKQRSYLESIRSSGKSLLTLINDILDLSKIEAGKMEIDKGPVDLESLFNEMKLLFEPQLKANNNKMKIYIEEGMPRQVFLSGQRFRQILFNLIGNACKFTENGQISLTAYTGQKFSEGTTDLHIHVKDTGQGIHPEEVSKIFDVFHQSGSANEKHQGTGLGLTITSRLVEMMKGTIEVESETGKGTLFKLVFKNIDFETVSSDLLPGQSILKNLEVADLPHIMLVCNNQELISAATDAYQRSAGRLHIKSADKILSDDQQLKGLMFALVDEGSYVPEIIQLLDKMVPYIFLLNTDRDELVSFPAGITGSFNRPSTSFQFSRLVERIYRGIQPSLLPNAQLYHLKHEEIEPIMFLWEKAVNSHFLEDAGRFAEELIQFGEVRGIVQFTDYARQLQNYIQAFDVERTWMHLKHFDVMLRTLTSSNN
jgi:signal transduction histidine kinase